MPRPRTTLPAAAISDARAVQDAAMSERQLQDAIIDCARRLGYLVYHPWTSVHSEAGFPDLCMVHAGQLRILFVELKKQGEDPSEAQWEWITDIDLVADQAVIVDLENDRLRRPVGSYVWRPSDWSSGRIEAVLRGDEEER